MLTPADPSRSPLNSSLIISCKGMSVAKLSCAFHYTSHKVNALNLVIPHFQFIFIHINFLN